MLKRARARAIKGNLPFDLDIEHIQTLIVPICPVLGVKLNYTLVNNTDRTDSPSLDRFNPALGYVKGNVAIISWRANRIKMDATTAELLKITEWMIQRKFGAQTKLSVHINLKGVV